MSLKAIHGAVFLILAIVINSATCDSSAQIPDTVSALNSWFQANVKPVESRKGTLDPLLVAAEAKPKIIKVRKNGSGDFKTVTDAVKSIPLKNTQRVIVDIGGGVYTEKVEIDVDQPFVTFYGSPKDMPTISFGGTAKKFGTDDSATLIVMGDYFVAANIIFQNTAPKPEGAVGGQGVALRIWGNKAALYNCKLLGFQDTLCDDHGIHFYKDCYIEGTVDFIFGRGKSMFVNSELHVIKDKFLTVITAQARSMPEEDTGFVFAHCTITGEGDGANDRNGAYLGRAWQKMPRVIFAYTKMGSAVSVEGWYDNIHPERQKTVEFAEYKSSGPGFTPEKRVKYSKQYTAAQAEPYLTLDYVEASKWLLPPPQL
ncbi:pectinesterase 2-like [Mercurialis annua]|uniref:pectinesterase 2-like n=1 Tax=Mercurialis annua TaxID=3986 RepID=UPI0021609542|nr:pectinesterase 2-like [Mercurialis annua]